MSSTQADIRIKFMYRGMENIHSEFRYEDAVFIYDADCRDYDWLVVYDELPNSDCGTFCGGREQLACPRERTMLLTVEPTSIKCYSTAYTHQFGHFLTNRPPAADRHPNYHFGEGYFAWFYEKPYAEICSQRLPPKTKQLSVVCSSKQMEYTAHAARFNLIKNICAAVPECDWFGHGVKPLAKKSEALDDYRYSLAIENHVAPGHWSEKIADVLLAEALPFYAGDPDLERVLPAGSFIRVPIDDPQKAVAVIRKAMDGNEHEKRLPAIREAKKLLLTRYNLWAQTLKVIREVKDQRITPADDRHPFYVMSRHRLRRNPIVALSDCACHLKEAWQRLLR